MRSTGTRKMFSTCWFFFLCALLVNETSGINILPNPKHAERKDGYKLQSSLKIDDKDIDRSIAFSAMSIEKLQRLEENILRFQNAAHVKFAVSNADDDAKETARNALIVEKATNHLVGRFCYKHKIPTAKCLPIITDYNATNGPDGDLRDECASLTEQCTPQQQMSKYREFNGACNHKYSNSLGQARTTYKRLLPPVYSDGIHTIKKSTVKKVALPSARLVSEKLIQRETDDLPSGRFTTAFVHWGEFVEHDLAQTASHKMMHFDSSISCCTPEGRALAPRHVHPFCSAIDVPRSDKFYEDKFVTCLSYVRSMGGLRDDCSFGPLDQLNQATHYLDASHIYGNNAGESSLLENAIRGQLRNSSNFLPRTGSHSLTKEMPCHDESCYTSGDPRVNSNPQLTVLHTIFLREHNRLAEKLAELNPHWNDEKLFQEARRLLIAEIQHITYDEWLPLLLPEEEMNETTGKSFQNGVDPAVSNSFATAAIRAIKSMIPEYIQLFNEDRTLNSSLQLGEHLHKNHVVEEHDFGHFARGMTTQKSRKIDMAYAKDLLDVYGDDVLGLDVISLDVQRGRDHGLPGYNAYRKLCGLKTAAVFDDLLDNIAPDTVKMLSQVYNHPDDVDLIIGGLAETPKKNPLLGDTFTCILADQFRRTRDGDRYFYSFTGSRQPWEFTGKQIEEIQKVTLAKIICDNANVQSIQADAFMPISNSNKLVKCHGLPTIDLALWEE